MKTLMRTTMRLCALAAFALAAPFAWAQAPGSGIGSTLHDFTGATYVGAGAGDPAAGACTFCHTPHQASEQVLVWNRALSANNFEWPAGSATSGGTSYSSFAPAYTGTTVKCLSCHDGTVAIGEVAWFNKGGPRDFSLGVMTGPSVIAAPADGSLAGNHPVAMPYPFNNVGGNTYNGVTTGNGVVLEFVPDPTGTGIRLYNDNGGVITAGAVAGSTGIECASCHDPHNSSTVQGPFFLRGTMNGANYICRKCHAK